MYPADFVNPATDPATAIDADMTTYDFTWYFDANAKTRFPYGRKGTRESE